MKLHFLGANRQVTGSCTLLETAGWRVMIDCGLYQEPSLLDRNRAPWPIPPAQIDHLLLTHAHLDHCGLIPRLVREGFAGPIHATAPTIDLTRLVLHDAVHLQSEERQEDEELLYSERDVDQSLALMQEAPYWEPIRLGEDVAVRFRDAGHILGSASLELMVREGPLARRIGFSGDLGQPDRPLVRPASPLEQADYLIMESTYGDADHERDPIEDTLARLIVDTAEAGGKLLIPTFAIERAQEILFILSRLSHDGRIPHLRTFVDSPMAAEAAAIFATHRHLLDRPTQALLDQGEQVFRFPGLTITRTREESMTINDLIEPAIILAGSGMCTGGRILYHLAQHIDQPQTTVLFTGYQAHDTLGRQILNGASTAQILGETHAVRARIERLHGLSGHAGRSGLLQWLSHLQEPPRMVYLNHGQDAAARSLAAAIHEQGWPVHIPDYREVIELM